jgi:rapamycin-insensitive companion of mTOR
MRDVDTASTQALTSLVEEESSVLTRKATLLLGEILILASRILPYKTAARIQVSDVKMIRQQLVFIVRPVQVLPRLFEMAAAYDDPAERTAALTALASISSFHRARRKLEPPPKYKQWRQR